MKKKLWYSILTVVTAVIGAMPSAGQDVGRLQPVEVVWISRQGTSVVVRTDTGDYGSGETLRQAVEDLTVAAAGEVFLETAEHLLLSPECVELIDEAVLLLRPSCTVCMTAGEPVLEEVGAYLRQHSPRLTLNCYRAEVCDLPVLKTEEGRMELVP